MDASTLSAFGSAATAFGNFSAGQAAARSGALQGQALELQAQQARIAANAEMASGTRAAAEVQRQNQLVQSRAIALAAASGGTTDPSVMNLLSMNAGEGAYKAQVALYNAKSRSDSLTNEAAAAEFNATQAVASGLSRQSAYRVKAFSDLMNTKSGGFSRFFDTQPAAPVSEAVSIPVT